MQKDYSLRTRTSHSQPGRTAGITPAAGKGERIQEGTEYRRKREGENRRKTQRGHRFPARSDNASKEAKQQQQRSERYFEVSTIREHRSETADRHVTMAQVDSTAAILLGWLCCSSLPSVLIRPAIGPCEVRLC